MKIRNVNIIINYINIYINIINSKIKTAQPVCDTGCAVRLSGDQQTRSDLGHHAVKPVIGMVDVVGRHVVETLEIGRAHV